MAWRKPRQPPRQSHPDPARELELQRILDLRSSIGRREKLAEQYRDEIADLHEEARVESSEKRARIYLEQAAVLHRRILKVEETIPATHEEIAALAAKIPADDLAFL